MTKKESSLNFNKFKLKLLYTLYTLFTIKLTVYGQFIHKTSGNNQTSNSNRFNTKKQCPHIQLGMAVCNSGTLQLSNVNRQKDTHPSNTYRIIPYKSSISENVSYSDYVSNSICELKEELGRLRQDYYRLVAALWKILSEIDSTPYDQHIMFFNLPTEQICNQISLIRNLNLPQQEDSSLRLSAIIKVDQNSITSPRQQFFINNTQQIMTTTTMSTDYYHIQPQHSPQRSVIRQCRRDSSLYRIVEEEGEEENVCNLSRIDDKQEEKEQFAPLPMIERRNSSLGLQINQQQYQSPQRAPHLHLNLSSQKQPKQPRRTSFLLKQKISIALHEQQQLRQLLEQQLQKMTQQLDEKNEYLLWTVEELNIRNELIDKLKQVIVRRDEALKEMESGQAITGVKKCLKTNEHILEQQDKQIGQLINSLIQRTDSTFEDLQYLIAKSVQPMMNHQHLQQQLQMKNQQSLSSSNQADRTIDIGDLERSVQRSFEEERSQSLSKVAMSPQQCEQEQHESRVSNSSPNNKQQNMQVSYQALQPKKMNFSPSPTREPIKYLTKQHFLEAERKTANNYILENVKMTQSVKMDSSSTSLINAFTY